jgi:hypothetical protein
MERGEINEGQIRERAYVEGLPDAIWTSSREDAPEVASTHLSPAALGVDG